MSNYLKEYTQPFAEDGKPLAEGKTLEFGDQERSVITSVSNVLAAASGTTASVIGGGSVFALENRQPGESESDLNEWYPELCETIGRFRSPTPTIRLVPQVGPLNTGPVHFGGGVPVRGHAQLTLYQSGHVNFIGHFHDSGFPNYRVTFAVGVRSQRGVLYQFARSGVMYGTMSPGSRDFDWTVQELRPVIREDWPNIAVNSTWWWDAKVNWDILSALESIKRLAETAGAVTHVIRLL